MASIQNPYFYSLGGLGFYLSDHQNITSRPILSKNKQRESFHFLTKNHGLTTLEKSLHGNYVKSIFYSLGGLGFQRDDHDTLFLGLLCEKKRKFPVFVYKHGLTPSKKKDVSMTTMSNQNFFV